MKKQEIMKRVAVMVVLLFFVACNCKKVGYDYSAIWLEQYYVAQLSDDQKLYVMFHQADSLVTGEYFVYNGKAVAEKFPFRGKTCKKQIRVDYPDGGKIKRTHGTIRTTGDTLRFFSGTRKQQSGFVFVREQPVRMPLLKQRYHTVAFGDVRVQETNYGKARGYYTSKPVEKIGTDEYASIILQVGRQLAGNIFMSELPLNMDIYQPVGDTIKKRPLLVIVHGGAFVIGDKDTKTMQAIGRYFAQRGYLVASINYRLGYMFVPGGYVYLERCIYRAVQDARAALRFLVHHVERYRIDPDNIFIGGNSAGGIIAMKTTFMEQREAFESASGSVLFLREALGCLDCSGNDLIDRFQIRGVINMWGALTDTAMISKRENIPVLLFHGDADEIVPPGHQYPFANVGTEFSSFFSRKTFGSVSIHEHMQRLGFNSRLVMFPGAGHDPQNDQDNNLNDNINVILDNMNTFLFDIVSRDSTTLAGKYSFLLHDRVVVYRLKGKGKLRANWHIEGGKIIEMKNNGTEVSIVWFLNAVKHSLKCMAMNENGLVNVFEKEVFIQR
jgi:pimeloyl-ACP methyl ester carboxylesterase